MFCSQCGTAAAAEARFCGKCGAALAGGGAGAAPATARKGGGLKGCLLLVAAVVGLGVVGAVAFVGWAAVTMASWETTVQQHLEFIRKDDFPAAYQLTSRRFQRTVPEPAFTLMVAFIASGLRQSSFEVTDRRALNDKQAVVKGFLKDKKGEKSAVAFTIVRDGEEWRIDEIDLDPE